MDEPPISDAVDVSSLLALRQLQRPGATDAVARIAGRFIDETAERVASLREAAASGDALMLERAAHALKGIAGTVGANEVRDKAQQLELIGREGRTDGARDLVAALDVAVARAQPVYERLRSGSS